MILLDANILLYAYGNIEGGNDRVRAWLLDRVRAGETIGLPWVSLWAFVRVTTNPRVSHPALSLAEAFAAVRVMQAIPRATTIHPGLQHAEILERLAVIARATGPRITDAVLAALAIEHGATIASTDRDFARFPGLKWVNPLD